MSSEVETSLTKERRLWAAVELHMTAGKPSFLVNDSSTSLGMTEQMNAQCH